MQYVTEDNFNDIIKDKLVLVDFFATWCGPCSMQTEVLEKIESSRTNKKYEIVKVDVDKNQELAKEYRIESIPTLMVFKDSRLINKHVGFMNENDIITMMDEDTN